VQEAEEKSNVKARAEKINNLSIRIKLNGGFAKNIK
jgi:hypothetical protein